MSAKRWEREHVMIAGEGYTFCGMLVPRDVHVVEAGEEKTEGHPKLCKNCQRTHLFKKKDD